MREDARSCGAPCRWRCLASPWAGCQLDHIFDPEAERLTDLGYACRGNAVLFFPSNDRGSRHAQELLNLRPSSGFQNEIGYVHARQRRTFRPVLSSGFVERADTRRPSLCQNAEMFDLKANARDMGRRIAALRSRAGQNQADLAAAVGKSRTFITDIETGSNTPGIETAIGIAEEFKVPLDWLLGRKVPCDGPLAGHFVDDLDKLAGDYLGVLGPIAIGNVNGK